MPGLRTEHSISIRLILLLLFAGTALHLAAEPPAPQPITIPLRYFGDISCDHCDTFESAVVPDLEERFAIDLDVEAADIMRADVRRALADELAEMGYRFTIFPVLIIGNNVYQGHSAIERNLAPEIAAVVETGEFRGRIAEEGTSRAGATDAQATDAPDVAGASTTPFSDELVLHYFWAIGCPVCDRAVPVLDELQTRFPELTIRRYELSENREYLPVFRSMAAERGVAASGVPAFFIGDTAWIGLRPDTPQQLAEAVERGRAGLTGSGSEGGGAAHTASIELPLFGTITLANAPAVAVTGAIALVDGFNPCSLWVLTFLIGLMVRTGSRRRTLAVGAVFLVVTAAVYGLFILGLFQVFAAATGILAVRIVVAVMAVSMGLINMKDYFAFKVGFSLTIPERFQTLIARHGRTVFEKSGSPLLLVGATALFALGISVVELPCTAGFPVIWSQYMAATGLTGSSFWALFTLYLAIYLADELIIVVGAVILMKRVQIREAHGRVLKLIGGSVMVALGLAYLFAPEVTQSMTGVALVFASAIGMAALILLASRLHTALSEARS
ncbi:MAG: thioredoxin [Spirochaetaceae bacterium]|nr:MAG: thioredoxin [Spirochaetaceae bacterium]